jgi:LuxR family maltose regulon positive regulatory protein
MCVTVGAPMLRFQVDETLQLVRNRFGARVSTDAAIQLHELTEGWPLGLQLALSVIAAGQEPSATISAISAHAGEPGDRFVPVMLANLAAADADFLTRIAILDPLHPDLCRAVTEDAAAAERLNRLSRETPILVAGGSSGSRVERRPAREGVRAGRAQPLRGAQSRSTGRSAGLVGTSAGRGARTATPADADGGLVAGPQRASQ